MLLKNSSILELDEKLKSIQNKKFPISVSFIISKNVKKITDAVEEFEQARNDLLMKYGEKDKNENPIIQEENGHQKVKITDTVNFSKEYNELLNVELDISLDMIPKEALINTLEINPDNYDQLTINELSALNIMIKEE